MEVEAKLNVLLKEKEALESTLSEVTEACRKTVMDDPEADNNEDENKANSTAMKKKKKSRKTPTKEQEEKNDKLTKPCPTSTAWETELLKM